MSSFNDTVDLERAFLKAITSSTVMARTYMHMACEEMFSSSQRQVIFQLAVNALQESNAIISRSVFEYEISSRFDQEIVANCICEWNIIEGVDSFDSPELIVSKLRDAVVGRKTLKVSENVIDLLSQGNVQEAVSLIKREAMMLGGSKEDRPMMSLTDTQKRLQLIRDRQQYPDKFQGLKIGLKTFDEQTGGLFPGELTLIAGITGLGKSTLCRQIAKGIVTLNGAKNVLHIANEEYLEQVQYKYDALFTEVPYQDFKFAKISEDNLDRWQKYMQQDMQASGRGQIFIKEVAAFTDISLVEQQYRILENRGIPIHCIVIDHLPHVKPIQAAWGENDERSKAAADCKELARWLKVHVITPTQAATEVEKKQMSGKRAGKLDVYGSKGQIHVANTFMIITYKGTDDTQVDLPDYLRDVFWLCDGKKNRDGAPFYFMAKHYVKIGKVVEIADPSRKPTKEEDKLANEAIKEGEKKDVEKPEVKNDPVVVPKVISPELNTGIRDESMEFIEKIDSDGPDEEETTVVTDTPISDDVVKDEINDAIATEIKPSIKTETDKEEQKVHIEQTRLEKASDNISASQSILAKMRMQRKTQNGV